MLTLTRELRPLFFLSLITFLRSSVINPSHYVGLIFKLHVCFRTSSVFLLHHDFDGMQELSELRESIRLLSMKGIRSIDMDFASLEDSIAFYRTRIHRPLFVVILKSEQQVDEFSEFTENFRMAYPVWLLILNDEFEPTTSARLRDENIFHLRFDTEMFVLRANSTNIQEWYSLRNVLRTVDYATWDIDSDLELRSTKNLYPRRSNLEKSSIFVAIVDVRLEARLRLYSTQFQWEINIRDDFQDPPTVTYRDSTLSGCFGHLILELMDLLNFDIKFVWPEEQTYGSWNETEGRWTGMINLLVEGQADISASELIMTTPRMLAVDFTHPLIFTNSRLYIRQPEGGVRWSAYSKIFSPKISMAILVSICLAAAVLTIAAALGNERITCHLITQHLLTVWGIYCQQGLATFPTSLSLRITYFFVLTSAFVCSTAFSASLISFLAASSAELPFSTLEEFVEDGSYKVVVFPKSADHETLMTSADPVFTKLLTMLKPVPELPVTLHEGFRQVCSERVAFFTQRALKNMVEMRLPCKVVDVDTEQSVSLAIAITKGSPYYGVINHYIKQFRYYGIFDRLKQIYAPPTDSIAPTLYKEVAVDHVVPILMVLGVGSVLGFLVLFTEIFFTLKCVSRKSQTALITADSTESEYYVTLSQLRQGLPRHRSNVTKNK